MKLKKFHFLLLAAVFICTGCGKTSAPPQKPGPQKPGAAAPAQQAATQKEEPKVEKEVYAYDPKGRRDPFFSLIDVAKEKPQRKKGATPIENFDIDEIRLIAIAWDKRDFYAMITLPDNKSYTIRKGMTLGLYGGKVHEITRTSVLIREQVKDHKGQIKIKDTTLRLRREGENE